MADPCKGYGLGDCSCDEVEEFCCDMDVSGVLVQWTGCGGDLPQICGWVTDPTDPLGFRVACWETPPGKKYTKFTYEITNGECDFTTDPGVMERWEMVNWGLGQSRTFVRDFARNMRTCCGTECTPAGHPANSTFPLHGILGSSGGGPNGYFADGTPINPNNPCRNLPIGGAGVRPPSRETIFFQGENVITVLHPCRTTDQGIDTIERCTVKITAHEYTAAIHRQIITDVLNGAQYPPYRMLRRYTRTNPCQDPPPIDSQYVSWPDDKRLCGGHDIWHFGSDPNHGAKVLIRRAEPGICVSTGHTGPQVDLEIKLFAGQGLPFTLTDCFNCGERPVTIIPAP